MTLIAGSSAWAFDFSTEAGRPVIRNFRPTDYRGHPQVFSIAFSAEGYVCFGNQEGMLEFDGIRWRHHPAPTPLVFHLETDPQGRIWIGGNDELGYFEPTTDGARRRYVSIMSLVPAALKPTGRTNSVIFHEGAVYFSTSRGIVRWRDGQVRIWDEKASRFATFHRIEGQLWTHCGQFGLWRFAGDQLVSVSQSADLKREARIIPLQTSSTRSRWVVASGGDFWLDHTTGTTTREEGFLDRFVRDARLNTGGRLRDGTIAVAASGKGLLLVSADGTQFRLLDRTSGLADNVVLSLGEDREGGLWLGYNSGAARLDVGSGVTVFDAGNGPTPGTADIWGRHEGRVYLGTFDGVYLLEPGDPALATGAKFKRISNGLSNVFGLESVDGELLVACNLGLVRLNADYTHTVLVDTRPNNPYWLIRSKHAPQRYYLAGQRGLTVVERTSAGWTKLGERLDLGDAHNMVEEDDGTLWLSTYSRGFWRVPAAHRVADWSAATFEHYRDNCGLPPGFVWTTVTRGLFGPVFFTDKGAVRFDAARRRFEPEDRFIVDGAASPLLTPTTLDAHGAMWASVYRDSTIAAAVPLGRFSREGQGKVWEPAPAGALQEIGFSGAAVMVVDRAPDGEVLWSRGYENMIRMNLDRLARASSPWKVSIRELRSGSQVIPLPAAAPRTPLELPFSREPLSFSVAAPRFAALDGLRFQFRLLGFNDAWSDFGPSAETTFTNLEGGPFTFEVRARDASGSVSEPATLAFSVRPPWPRTPLAYAVYCVLGGAGIFGLVRWRLRQSERERARLESLVAARTSELAAANQAKSLFLANMSHELRTPLNGVLGYAQVLQRSPHLAGEDRARIQIMQASGEHLLRMINEVLDLSKIEAGKFELRPAPFHLPQLLRDLAAIHQPRATEKGLEFRLLISDTLPDLVVGDAQKLRQVLDNLLGNAVKFTLRGEVQLSVNARAGGTFDFAVRDTGVGISPADRAKLFEPFQQAVEGRPAEPGTGLGLAISRRIVSLLGGALEVESTRDAGSTFSFSLRLEVVAGASAAPIAIARHVTGYDGPRRRLLVVDDIQVNRAVLVDLLTPLGFELREAADGQRALELARELEPHLVFLDLRMPGMDGLELARQLRALPSGQQLKLIAMSASVLSFNRDDAFAAGCDDFLAKPFREADLLAKLGLHLGLAWQEAPAAASAIVPGPDRASPNLLHPLLDAARRGRVVELRRLLAELSSPAPTLAAELQSLLVSYKMDALRHRLERELASTPATARPRSG